MNDYILRATAAEGCIRAFFATTRDTVNHAFRIHQTTPVVTAALGRMLTAAAMLGATLKNDDDLITLLVKGDGPMQGVVVTSDSASRVKGYPYENIVELPLKADGKLDVGGAVGEGTFTLIKDMGMKEPYSGSVPLVSGEIAEDLSYYFAKSEQTPSAVALGVLVDVDYTAKQSGGFIIQLLPGCDEKIVDELEEILSRLPQLTTLLEDGRTLEDLMDMTLGRFGFVVNDTIPVAYHCGCNRRRVEKALICLGREELAQILEEDKKAELHCHFCNKNYFFGEADLRLLLD